MMNSDIQNDGTRTNFMVEGKQRRASPFTVSSSTILRRSRCYQKIVTKVLYAKAVSTLTIDEWLLGIDDAM